MVKKTDVLVMDFSKSFDNVSPSDHAQTSHNTALQVTVIDGFIGRVYCCGCYGEPSDPVTVS